MQSRLIVKNFGPIKYVDLDLRNVNVFIGPQASGKSALAKLFTIVKAPRKFLKNGNSNNPNAFVEVLDEYNIASFLQPDSEIEFASDLHQFKFSKGSITYISKLKLRVAGLDSLIDIFKDTTSKNKPNLFENISSQIKDHIEQLQKAYDTIRPKFFEIKYSDSPEIKYAKYLEVRDSAAELEEYLSSKAPLYIPSERCFINIVKNSSLNLLLNNVPIPKHILLFGAELEKSTIPEIKLDFLHENLVYRRINGEDRIFTSSENSIKLLEAASGVQSAVNILIPLLSQDKTEYQRSFVIEEPELNLFPDAQYELIKTIESLRKEAYASDIGTIHTYTTHSPYILSSFNNLLYASKIWNAKRFEAGTNIENKLKEIIPVNSNIQPQTFTAYQIKNGLAQSIFDQETGLIGDNYIDESSDKMADDFNDLMNLMK